MLLVVIGYRQKGGSPKREWGEILGLNVSSYLDDAEVIDLLERARSCTASPDVAGVVETGGEE
jgi:hypothetical protein